jgi:hypothetical protein
VPEMLRRTSRVPCGSHWTERSFSNLTKARQENGVGLAAECLLQAAHENERAGRPFGGLK